MCSKQKTVSMKQTTESRDREFNMEKKMKKNVCSCNAGYKMNY